MQSGCDYNPPNHNGKNFLDFFSKWLDKFRNLIICGDFNINLLRSDVHYVSDYINIIQASGYFVLNKISSETSTRWSCTTRTLIDHVITDLITDKYILAIGDTYLSDHKYLILNINKFVKNPKIEYYPKVNFALLRDRAISADLNSMNFDEFHNFLMSDDDYYKTWFPDELKPLTKQRDKFYRLKKKFPRNTFYITQFEKLTTFKPKQKISK
jgi:Endonuclease-reverse transcriptase